MDDGCCARVQFPVALQYHSHTTVIRHALEGSARVRRAALGTGTILCTRDLLSRYRSPNSRTALLVCTQGKGSEIALHREGKRRIADWRLYRVGICISGAKAIRYDSGSVQVRRCNNDDRGRRVSVAELEKFVEADTLANAVACGDLTEYELYFLTLAGDTVRREDFESSDDQAALTHAKQFVDGKVLELWSVRGSWDA